MNKEYNVDDILLEIKAKKSRQSHKEPGENSFVQQSVDHLTSVEAQQLSFRWKEEPTPAPKSEEKVTIPLPEEKEPAVQPQEPQGFSFRFQEEEPAQPAPQAVPQEAPVSEPAFSFEHPQIPEEPKAEVKKKEAFKVTLPEEDEEQDSLNLDYKKYFSRLPEEEPEEESFQFRQTGLKPPLDLMGATREVPSRSTIPAMEQPAAKEPFRLNFDFDDADNDEGDLSDLTPVSGKNGLFPDEMLEDEQEEKRSRFRRKKKKDVDVPEQEEVPKDDESDLDDYTSAKDKESVIRDMKMIKASLIIRLVLMIAVFGVSLYLALSTTNPAMDLPSMIQPETQLRQFMIANTVVAALGAIICSNTVGGGLISLMKLKADTDALPSMAVIATLAQGVCFIVKPDLLQMTVNSVDASNYTITTAVALFFPVAMLILLFNIVGKIMIILRIQNNFKLVASDRSKFSVNMMENKGLLKEWTKNLEMEEYLVAYPVKTRFLSHFLEYSYSEDHAESMSHVLAPVSILAGILISVLAYVFHQNVAMAISTFAAAMCICAPLTSTIAANYPMLRLSNKLIPNGAMVAGYDSISEFADTEGIVMKASDIFPPENVTLHGIKAFDQSKIDSVILDAASVVCSSNGMLSGVFTKIIGSNKSMLRPVENVTYEDSMGLSAWVDGKRVLVGNRDLMINHGVEVPSSDYEKRYVRDSKNIIYLSNSGELSAMFVISYNPNNQVMDELDKLADNGMFLIVETSDPNITAEKIHDAYDFPLEQIQIMPAKTSDLYRTMTEDQPQAPAHIGFMGGAKTMIRAICDCITIKSSIAKSVVIQMAALIIGYGIIAVFSLVGDLGMLSPLHLIAYQLFWSLLVFILPNLKRL